jgi:hypothetical protein
VTGFGVAGTFAGSYIIIGISAPPEKRPAMTGFMGSAYAIASVIGPCKISLSNSVFRLFQPIVRFLIWTLWTFQTVSSIIIGN